MKSARLVFLITLTIFIAACATFPPMDTSRLQIGMSERQVIGMFGHPYHVNRTMTKSGDHEQWIYNGGMFGEDKYLYFDGGKLTAWQG